jgi:hypothetical protein
LGITVTTSRSSIVRTPFLNYPNKFPDSTSNRVLDDSYVQMHCVWVMIERFQVSGWFQVQGLTVFEYLLVRYSTWDIDFCAKLLEPKTQCTMTVQQVHKQCSSRARVAHPNFRCFVTVPYCYCNYCMQHRTTSTMTRLKSSCVITKTGMIIMTCQAALCFCEE